MKFTKEQTADAPADDYTVKSVEDRLTEAEATIERILTYLDPHRTGHVLFPPPVGERPEIAL